MRKARHYSPPILPVLIVFLSLSCTAVREGRPPIQLWYGDPVSYGEGRHPGVDYRLAIGTPIIACSDGTVEWVEDRSGPSYPSYAGGYFVMIRHQEDFYSVYAHLDKVFVRDYGQIVKRGQLIGLSGASNSGNPHLHFGLLKGPRGGKYITNTYNPLEFGLDGKLQCFDPNKDYSKYSPREITIPVACREYRKILATEIENLLN